jgi:GGDEF domain-containing protein
MLTPQVNEEAFAAMESALVSRPPAGTVASARALELASGLRDAVMDGDESRMARLLSDLLRVRGLTKGQRVAVQMRALLDLVQSLRSAALTDEVTGLHNRRGFMQTATRLLDLATRDGQAAHLVYFRVGKFRPDQSENLLVRQMGNFLRDLFPGYGIYDVLGRLSTREFAALTTDTELASRSAVSLRIRRRDRSSDVPALPLAVGLAHFSPLRPVTIDELLQSAVQIVDARAPQAVPMHADVARIASSGFAPQPGVTLC